MPINFWIRSDAANRWFAGALAAALAIALLDAVAGAQLVVVELLAVPPLVAAVGSGPRRTAAVAGLCAGLAVVLGIPDEMFLETRHVVTIVAVAAVGLAAFYIARLRDRLVEQERRTKLAADAGAAMQRSLDAGGAMHAMAQLAVPLLADSCVVHVKDPDGSTRELAAARRAADQPVTDSLTLPLRARGQRLGSIVFTRANCQKPFAPADRKLAEMLAERAAVALDNSRLYARASDIEAELRASTDQLTAILDGVADGVTAQDPTGRMVYANEEALKLLGFPSVPAIQAVPIRYVMSRFDAFDEHGDPFPPERLPGRAALGGRKAADALVRMRRRDTGEERWEIIKATPIMDAAGELSLVISVYEDVTVHMERERSQRMLARAGELLARSLSYERTLDTVAQLCVPEFADLCTIDLVQSGQIKRVAVAAADDDNAREIIEMRNRYPLDPQAPTGVPAVIRSGAAELYPDLDPEVFAREAASPNHADLIARLGLRSAIFVPMTARGRTFGAMSLCAGPSGRVFDDSDLYLAEELAARCAMAIDNARLFRERTRIARTLQESLLPPVLPELPGVDIGARFHAAGAGYEVGGDFYDVFDIGRGSFGVTIGDVCGKGADAASVTALARYTMRATALREPSPAEVLRTLNDALLQPHSDRLFCTVLYVRFDPAPRGMRATIASAGHPLPLALRHGGGAGEVGAPGTLLGVVLDPEIRNVVVDLAPGDVLVLYTDGVTEARAPKRVWGSNDLVGFVGRHEGLRASAIAERIERGALSAQADEPRDDVAIVVLKVAGADAVGVAAARRQDVSAV